MDAGKGFIYIFDKGMAGRFRDVEAGFIVKGALVKVPIVMLRLGEGYGLSIKGGKGVNDKLVGRCGFQDFLGKCGVKHVDLKVGKEDLELSSKVSTRSFQDRASAGPIWVPVVWVQTRS